MSNDPYKPPGSRIRARRIRKLSMVFFPTLLAPIVILLLAPFSAAISGRLFFVLIVLVYPLGALLCATICANWVRVSRDGEGCLFTIVWFALCAFYTVAYFVL
jgi:hypothetical protein